MLNWHGEHVKWGHRYQCADLDVDQSVLRFLETKDLTSSSSFINVS